MIVESKNDQDVDYHFIIMLFKKNIQLDDKYMTFITILHMPQHYLFDM